MMNKEKLSMIQTYLSVDKRYKSWFVPVIDFGCGCLFVVIIIIFGFRGAGDVARIDVSRALLEFRLQAFTETVRGVNSLCTSTP